jgi:hypothetical protein
MAFAIIKELNFAECCSKRATIILPASFNQQNVLISTLIGAYPTCEGVRVEFLSRCAQLGFFLPKEVSKENLFLYKIAVVLYSLSKRETAVEEVNLVYDLPQ